MSTPIEMESIPTKWSNVISTMSVGSRNGMYFSDTNNGTSNNYPVKVSFNRFTSLPNSNDTLKSNGKTLQLNSPADGAFSYISKVCKICENCRTNGKTNPKSTNFVAISHDPTIAANECISFSSKNEVDGYKCHSGICSVPQQNQSNTDVLNSNSAGSISYLDYSKEKYSVVQVCSKCLKNLNKVCGIKQKGSMSRVSDAV